jgi:hypothetical protein
MIIVTGRPKTLCAMRTPADNTTLMPQLKSILSPFPRIQGQGRDTLDIGFEPILKYRVII